jgi:predicted SprT family Zn-dependent metalloprotease
MKILNNRDRKINEYTMIQYQSTNTVEHHIKHEITHLETRKLEISERPKDKNLRAGKL